MVESLVRKDDLKLASSTSWSYDGVEGEAQLEN